MINKENIENDKMGFPIKGQEKVLSSMDLANIFSRYVGRVIPLREEPYKTKDVFGCIVEGSQYRLKQPDHPVIKRIYKRAAENGLALRVWVPGMAGEMGNKKRLNVYINKGNDNNWRIQNYFVLG